MTLADRRNIRCVGGIVHNRAGHLLLIRRGHEPNKGKWSVPGGRVEPGETDEQAVARELMEETGLLVRVGALCGSITVAPYEIYDYLCTMVGGEPHAGDDAAEVSWVDAASFARMRRSELLTADLAATLAAWGVLPR
ncbi:MAG: NUDIX hydrolase [Sciscionella sp.]